MNKDINDLRNHLFAALDGLADRVNPMKVERAKAIADVARVIVDTAKAETQLLQAIGARGTGTKFIPGPPEGTTAAHRRLPGPTSGACTACGGRLRPETNGGGAVVDRCADCGNSPALLLGKKA